VTESPSRLRTQYPPVACERREQDCSVANVVPRGAEQHGATVAAQCRVPGARPAGQLARNVMDEPQVRRQPQRGPELLQQARHADGQSTQRRAAGGREHAAHKSGDRHPAKPTCEDAAAQNGQFRSGMVGGTSSANYRSNSVY